MQEVQPRNGRQQGLPRNGRQEGAAPRNFLKFRTRPVRLQLATNFGAALRDLVRPALVVRRVLEGRGPVEAVEGARPADHRPGAGVPAPVLLRVDCADLRF